VELWPSSLGALRFGLTDQPEKYDISCSRNQWRKKGIRVSDAATRFYQRNYDRVTALGELNTAVGPTHRYHRVLTYLDQEPPSDLLELGYGHGHLVAAVAARVRGKYNIIDIVDRRDEIALPSNVVTHISNLDNDFPIPSQSMDAVIALMIVEHLYDPFHSFSEIARILRPGGKAYVNLPNIASIRCRLELLFGKMPVTSSGDWFENREWDGNHIHYFVIADVKRLAAIYGLKMLALHPVGKYGRVKALWPSLLCHEITFVFERA